MPTNNLRDFLQGKSLVTSTTEEKQRCLYQSLLKSRKSDACYETNPQELLSAVSKLGPRQVCQYQFKTNDIVWICKECQKDETCVLCNACYQGSCHEGHDVYFYHSAVGGCCDCGDPDAWSPEGFCQHHGKRTNNPVQFIPDDIRSIAIETFKDVSSEIVQYCIDFAALFSSEAETQREAEASTSDSYYLTLYYDEFHSVEDFTGPFTNELLEHFHLEVHFTNSFINDGSILLHSVSAEEYTSILAIYTYFKTRGYKLMLTSSLQKKRAEHVLLAIHWLHSVSQTNDGFCQLICDAFGLHDMITIFNCSMKIDKPLLKALHNLFITLMALQSFKMVAAAAYITSFRELSRQFGLGYGLTGGNMFNVSVQFLNRDWVVNELIFNYNFFGEITTALKEMLLDSTRGGVPGFEYKHNIISKRRYNPVIGDLKVVFSSVEGSAQIFLSTCLEPMLQMLSTFQLIHKQTRATLMHVSFETREWMDAFNLILGITLLFDYTYGWLAQDPNAPNPNPNCCFKDGTEVMTYSSTSSVGFQLVEPHVVTELNQFLDETNSKKSVKLTRTTGNESSPNTSKVTTRSEGSSFSMGGSIFRALFGTTAKRVSVSGTSSSSSSSSSTSVVPPKKERKTIPMLSISSVMSKFLEACIEWQRNYYVSTPMEAIPFICREEDGRRTPVWFVHYWDRNERSFHLPLHRGFAKAIAECCRHDHHNESVVNIKEDMRRKVAKPADFIEFPLSVLIFAAQIKQGMWRRNGFCMPDQLLNYAEIPFCRIYKDLDYFLIQFILTFFSGHYFLNQLFYRFDLTQGLKEHRLAGSDPSYFNPMLDEALKIVVNLVSELPLPGSIVGSNDRVIASLRRELIHRLVCTKEVGGVTFAQLRESIAHTHEHIKTSGDVVDSVIFEISDKHATNPMQPPSYTLKKELWSEYDPCYPRINESLHQSAIEKRPKLTSNTPMVKRMTPCHFCFDTVRSNLLFDRTLLIVLRDIMLINVAHSSKSTVYAIIRDSWSWKVSESVFSTSIQLLTLAIHEIIDERIRSKSNSVSLNFINFLSEPIGHGSLDADITWLRAILDLYVESTGNSTNEVNTKFWFGWILDQLREFKEEYLILIDNYLKKYGQVTNKEATNLQRQNQTRDKALADMQANAEKFKAMMAEFGSDSEDEDDDFGEPATKKSSVDDKDSNEQQDTEEATNSNAFELLKERKMSIASASSQVKAADGYLEDEIVCIICQGGHKTEEPFNVLSYCGLSQCSKVFGPHSNEIYVESQPTTIPVPLKHFESNLNISFCGHAIHLKCFHTYNESSKRKSLEQRNLIYDPNKGQFQCPLCKKLNNVLIPDALHFHSFDDDISGRLANSSTFGSDDSWLNWISAPTLLSSNVLTIAQPRSLKEKFDKVDLNHDDENIESDSKRLRKIDSSEEFTQTIRNIEEGTPTPAPTASDVNISSQANVILSSLIENNTFNISELSSIFDDYLMKQLNANFWVKFLKELVRVYAPPVYANDLLETDKALSDMLQTAVSGVVFSIVSDEQLSTDSGRSQKFGSFDDLKFIPRIIDALSATITCTEYLIPFHEALMLTLRGLSGNSASFAKEASFLNVTENKKVQCKPLLSLQLLDYFVMCVVVAKGQLFVNKKGVEFASNLSESIQNVLKFVSIARLVQLMKDEAVSPIADEITSQSISVDSQEFQSLWSNLAKLVNDKCQSGQPLKNASISRILLHWSHFLVSLSQVALRICRELVTDVLTDLSMSLSPSENIQLWVSSVLSLDQIASERLSALYEVVDLWLDDVSEVVSDANDMKGSDKSDVDATKVNANQWYNPKFLTGSMKVPSPKLIDPPTDYSKLHANVITRCTYDVPCLCLVCGAILDGGGKGQCTAHTTICGGDTCVFFQVQDCNVMLCHGARFTPYPAPYVDMYGESQHTYRGKPLRLDQKRYDTLNQIWANHEIPREVASKRSNSTSVIVLGYY